MKKAGFLMLLLVGVTHAGDSAPQPYPAMAPAEQYLIASAPEEIALARTAAPPSISAAAEVLVLGRHGYQSAVRGKNGFVCFVERAWDANFDDPEFWNPKRRGPDCLNPAAVRSVLPLYRQRAEWALAGVSREQMIERTRAAVASGSLRPPESGSLSYMLSRQGYLGDEEKGPWLPHLMLFLPHGAGAEWGMGLEGSPILGADGRPFEMTVALIPVRRWSDGSPAPAPATRHNH